jgi:hypothetical protein
MKMKASAKGESKASVMAASISKKVSAIKWHRNGYENQ